MISVIDNNGHVKIPNTFLVIILMTYNQEPSVKIKYYLK